MERTANFEDKDIRDGVVRLDCNSLKELNKIGIKTDLLPDTLSFSIGALPAGWYAEKHELLGSVNVFDQNDHLRATVSIEDSGRDFYISTSLFCRYDIALAYDANDSDEIVIPPMHRIVVRDNAIVDGDSAIYTTGCTSYSINAAEAWLKEHYPDYENPDAYWER